MPDIFGVDIAGQINDALGPLVFAVVLHKVEPGTRDPGNLSAGTQPTTTDHNCRGFIDEYSDYQRRETRVNSGDRKAVILGASLPDGVVPEPGDQITAENALWHIYDEGDAVVRDPAGATYECRVR